MIDKKQQREILVSMVPNLKKTIDDRINQRIPEVSAPEKLNMKRSVLCHLMADALVGASKEEVAMYGDLTGALINISRQKQGTPIEDPAKAEEPVG